MLTPPVSAAFATEAPYFPHEDRTAAQQAGIRYERRVVQRLKALHPTTEAGQWIVYRAGNKSGICQPDAFFWLTPDHLVVVEIKLSYVREARQKLRNFYAPILQAIYPNAAISTLQIYKNWKRSANKRTLSIYNLSDLKPGAYKECQIVL